MYNGYIYIWFADYHAVLPVLFAKVFKKKSFVVNGGYDVNSLPELKYGIDRTKMRLLQNKWIFRNATYCLPVGEALKIKLLELVPEAKTIIAPNVVDYNTFTFSSQNMKERKQSLPL